MLCPEAARTNGGTCRVWRHLRAQTSDQGIRTACVLVADVQLLAAVENSQPELGPHLQLEHTIVSLCRQVKVLTRTCVYVHQNQCAEDLHIQRERLMDPRTRKTHQDKSMFTSTAHCVFDCPCFRDPRQEHARLFDDAHCAVRCLMWHRLCVPVISPWLAVASLLASIEMRSVGLFGQDIHMPINLGGCAHE